VSTVRLWHRVPQLVFFVVLVVPLVLDNQYILHLMVMWGIYAILTLSLNIIIGFTGQLSLGHAAFYGVGAYASAILVQRYGLPFPAGLAAAGLLAAVVGAAMAVPFLRLRGIYLGMATFGFGEIAHLVFRNWESMTKGSLGMRDIPNPTILGFTFSTQATYFYLVLAILIAVIVLSLRLINTAPGQVLLALREDELAAEAVGIPTTRYKVAAFGLGAGVAGVAGSLFAHYITYLSPENFTVTESMLALAMLIVGGRGNVLGSLAGSGILVVLPEALRAFPAVRILLYGGLLAGMAVCRPQGILGDLRWGQHTPSWSAGDGDTSTRLHDSHV
jgi:branched-chain amino acid transport system permease protein